MEHGIRYIFVSFLSRNSKKILLSRNYAVVLKMHIFWAFIYLFTYLFIHLFIYLFIYLFIRC